MTSDSLCVALEKQAKHLLTYLLTYLLKSMYRPNYCLHHLLPPTGRSVMALDIDREFVTSAKKFANFNEFSEIKKFVKIR